MSVAGDDEAKEIADAPAPWCLAMAALEARRIASLGRQIQDRLGPLLTDAGGLAFEAQGLDELVQQVDGLAVFLDAIGGQCDQAWQVSPVHAVANLGMTAQRVRLTSGQPTITDFSGDLELF